MADLSGVRFLTVAEVAEMMRVSNMTVYRLKNGGLLLYSVIAMNENGMRALDAPNCRRRKLDFAFAISNGAHVFDGENFLS